MTSCIALVILRKLLVWLSLFCWYMPGYVFSLVCYFRLAKYVHFHHFHKGRQPPKNVLGGVANSQTPNPPNNPPPPKKKKCPENRLF